LKNILVTGSKGFIGNALLKHILPPEYKVYEFNLEDGDISNPEALKVFHEKDISHVIHLAGRIYVPDSWNNPHQFYTTNVIGTLNVLEFCRLNQSSLTHVSAYLYGQPEKLPIAEGSKIDPNNPYAHSKYLSENLCTFYNNIFNIRIIILRPFNVFGIGQNPLFLIPSIIDQVLNDKIIVLNDLSPKRDYIYLEDLIKALLKTLTYKKDFGIFNIGSGGSLSVKEIVDKIQIVFKSNKEVKSRENLRKGEINDVVANISQAETDLDWAPEYSFQQGLELIYNEIMRNKPDVHRS